LSEQRTGRMSDRRRMASPITPFRLDLLVNPFGASLRVYEAIASRDDLHLPNPGDEQRLRDGLSEIHSLPATWFVLGNGVADLIVAALRLSTGPVTLFPPSDPEHFRLALFSELDVHRVSRSHRFAVDVEPDLLTLPDKTLSLVQTPNDPTGTILSPQDAVRLSRKSRLLVIDERHAAYSPRTVVPLVREFENIMVLRTFETWAGLTAFPIAYAIAPPKLAAALQEAMVRPAITTAALVAAEATLDDLPYIESTVLRVREEKARLFRTLRKLNMIRPCVSWANFLLARIERGDIEEFQKELVRRDLHLYRPEDPLLNDYFRISATTAEATSALKNALIDVAATL